jgi:glutamate carboxypeptidase
MLFSTAGKSIGNTMAKSFTLKLVLGFWLLAFAPNLASAERNYGLADAAERYAGKAIETIKELAAIESGSNDAAGLARMSDVLEQRLKDLDFEVRRSTSKSDVNADTLIGVKTGAGKHRIMLMAHMDTVYPPGTLATMPTKQEGKRLFGPGVLDAKGGIAVILYGLEALRDLNWHDYASITVLFNPDEETGSTGSGSLISSLAAEMDTVLSFEAGGSMAKGYGWVLSGTAAYAQVKMEVKGLSSHAGNDPEKGRNAVIELAHQLLMTSDVADGVAGAQLNWTNVKADQAFNRIPDYAVAVGDARITVEGAEIELLEALKSRVATSSRIPGTETSVSLKILRPGFRANAKSLAVAELARKVHAEVSAREIYHVPMVKGATDAGYAAVSDGVTVLEGLGPWGADYHGPGEYLDTDSLMPSIYQLGRMLIELGKM